MRRRGFLTLALMLTASLFGCGTEDGGGTGTVQGTIRDKNAKAVGDAVVQVTGGASTQSDFKGEYKLEKLAAGAATLTVTADWFSQRQENVTVKASQTTTLDVQLEEMPLKVDPDDLTLAETYNKTYDWTKDKASIAYAPGPTRRHLDNAIYYHNAAMYRDTSTEPALTPSPQPDIAAGATGFAFPITSGPLQGEEALVSSTIVDSFAKTGLPSSADYLMAEPVVNWLKDWDTSKSVNINSAVLAVRQQVWGSNSLRPQDVEMLWIQGGEIWVKVVFEGFVKLGAGVTDSDGDSRKEIFAKLNPKAYSTEIVDKLLKEYVGSKLTTGGLRTELSAALKHLYTSTNLQIKQTIGQPYDVTGVGRVKYPFLVHEQTSLKGTKVQGVLLVAP